MRHVYKNWQLKLCPFCGGVPYLERGSRTIINGEKTRVAYVRCEDCGARTARYRLDDFGRSSSSVEAEKCAVDHWNMRR